MANIFWINSIACEVFRLLAMAAVLVAIGYLILLLKEKVNTERLAGLGKKQYVAEIVKEILSCSGASDK